MSDRREDRAERNAASVPERPAHVMQTCPTCSAPLVEQRCKLVCSRCGFFFSCSDFY